MLANELRLGNLFIEENLNEIIKVIELKENEIIFSGNFLGKWQAKPIPISEDWLIKFGFFIINYNGIEATMPNKRYTIKSVKDYDGWFFCNGDTVLINLEFIHTLQNIWFFMTSQELKINQ